MTDPPGENSRCLRCRINLVISHHRGMWEEGALITDCHNRRLGRMTRRLHSAMMLAVFSAAGRQTRLNGRSECRYDQQGAEQHCNKNSDGAPLHSMIVAQKRSYLPSFAIRVRPAPDKSSVAVLLVP